MASVDFLIIDSWKSSCHGKETFLPLCHFPIREGADEPQKKVVFRIQITWKQERQTPHFFLSCCPAITFFKRSPFPHSRCHHHLVDLVLSLQHLFRFHLISFLPFLSPLLDTSGLDEKISFPHLEFGILAFLLCGTLLDPLSRSLTFRLSVLVVRVGVALRRCAIGTPLSERSDHPLRLILSSACERGNSALLSSKSFWSFATPVPVCVGCVSFGVVIAAPACSVFFLHHNCFFHLLPTNDGVHNGF